jgi:arginine utilization regulatory protein
MMTGKVSESVLYPIILENLREGVNVVDENGYIIYANKSSAKYALTNAGEMIGKHITLYYPKAALLEVIRTQNPVRDYKTAHGNGRTFIVNAFPLYINGEFSGGVATFRDITEIEELYQRLEHLEMELALSQGDDIFDHFIGKAESLKDVINKAQRSIASIGGPRHCIILGETGTGKTMLAKAMYYFAKKIKVLKSDAPFIEVNCAQFTNPDIAAMEIFGTERGAFTGAYDKPGLVELANGGVLFLDEAHALVQHQTMLLKLIEAGTVRRIGGRVDREVDIIVIAASNKNLKREFIPELYQRLAQYQIELPPLQSRSLEERQSLLEFFVRQYVEKAKQRNNLIVSVQFSESAHKIILGAKYDRNVRQFRDVINASIDAAAPLISNMSAECDHLKVVVQPQHIPYIMIEPDNDRVEPIANQHDNIVDELIMTMARQGMGARKIATELKRQGQNLEYYHIAYRLKKAKAENRVYPNSQGQI